MKKLGHFVALLGLVLVVSACNSGQVIPPNTVMYTLSGTATGLLPGDSVTIAGNINNYELGLDWQDTQTVTAASPSFVSHDYPEKSWASFAITNHSANVLCVTEGNSIYLNANRDATLKCGHDTGVPIVFQSFVYYLPNGESLTVRNGPLPTDTITLTGNSSSRIFFDFKPLSFGDNIDWFDTNNIVAQPTTMNCTNLWGSPTYTDAHIAFLDNYAQIIAPSGFNLSYGVGLICKYPNVYFYVNGLDSNDPIINVQNGTNTTSAEPIHIYPNYDAGWWSKTFPVGTPLDLRIMNQPSNKICVFTNAPPTVMGRDDINGEITCGEKRTITINVQGIIGTEMIGFKNNGKTIQNIVTNRPNTSAPYTDSFDVPINSAYDISIGATTLYGSKTCGLANTTGVASTNINNVVVSCQ